MFNLLKEVEEFQIITIFRHQIADADAMGAQFGMKHFLKTAFPNKEIYAIGDSIGTCAYLFPEVDHIGNDQVASSCAIVLDTANADRVDDQRFKTARKIIKIDHHIEVDNYGDVEYVDTSASASCEILTKLFKNTAITMDAICARYLYLGILADSISFTTRSTSEQTLRCAAHLISCGIDVQKIEQERSGIHMDVFNYRNIIRNRVNYQNGVAYAIMNAEDYERFGFSYAQAKENVFVMANVDEFEIWCLFTEDRSVGEGIYHGSLRSKNIPINTVASAFQGGGHSLACGVKNLTRQDIGRLLNALMLQVEENK